VISPDRHSRLRPWAAAAFGVAMAVILLAGPVAAGGQPSGPYRVAIIVGPAGEWATPLYIAEAERVARIATEAGASVARAYSPQATPERVIQAVADAKIVVYFGHGNGFPSPYSAVILPDRVNGWGLQGPAALGTHADNWADGTLRYYGEEWLVANLRPAPGFVMIYSNACYAAGAPELYLPPATEQEARQRVENYARPMFSVGAAGYFASDFGGSAERLVGDMLVSPQTSFGALFSGDAQFDARAVNVAAHPQFAQQEVWLHRSPDHNGRLDYWYAFAGDSAASLAGLTAWAWPLASMTWPSLGDRFQPRLVDPTGGSGAEDPHLLLCEDSSPSGSGACRPPTSTSPLWLMARGR